MHSFDLIRYRQDWGRDHTHGEFLARRQQDRADREAADLQRQQEDRQQATSTVNLNTINAETIQSLVNAAPRHPLAWNTFRTHVQAGNKEAIAREADLAERQAAHLQHEAYNSRREQGEKAKKDQLQADRAKWDSIWNVLTPPSIPESTSNGILLNNLAEASTYACSATTCRGDGIIVCTGGDRGWKQSQRNALPIPRWNFKVLCTACRANA